MGKPDLSTALVDAGGGRRSKTAKAEIRYRACLAGSDPFASATVRQSACINGGIHIQIVL